MDDKRFICIRIFRAFGDKTVPDTDLLRIIQEESKKCYNNEGNLNQIIESIIDKYAESVEM